MRIAKLLVSCCFVVIFVIPASVWGMIASTANQQSWYVADGGRFSLLLGAQVTSESGDMTYTIEGPQEGGWKSELEWPLDGIFYAGGTVSASIWGKFHLNLGAWKSLNEDTGTMKDSDWLFSYSSSRAIYGEFESTVDAIQADINARYDFFRGTSITFGALLGYSYEYWEWTAGDGFQQSPLPRYDVGPVQGTGIVYEETLKFPYMGVAASLLQEGASFGVNVYALYSPIAHCEDVDDHVIRYKESVGSTQGTFWSVGTDLQWVFSPSWSLTGKIDYSSYDLEGEQDQEFYAGDNIGIRYDDIDMTVKGSQFSFAILVGYAL